MPYGVTCHPPSLTSAEGVRDTFSPSPECNRLAATTAAVTVAAMATYIGNKFGKEDHDKLVRHSKPSEPLSCEAMSIGGYKC